MKQNSFFLTPDLIAKAVLVANKSTEYMLGAGLVKRKDLHLVILNPNSGFGDRNLQPADLVNSHILWEFSFGNEKEWEHDFKFYARTKALTAMRHQMPTSKLKDTDRVLLLQAGDAHMAGGVYENGLAVGVSGVEGCLDETIAWCYLNFIIGFANQAKEKYMENHYVIGHEEAQK